MRRATPNHSPSFSNSMRLPSSPHRHRLNLPGVIVHRWRQDFDECSHERLKSFLGSKTCWMFPEPEREQIPRSTGVFNASRSWQSVKRMYHIIWGSFWGRFAMHGELRIRVCRCMEFRGPGRVRLAGCFWRSRVWFMSAAYSMQRGRVRVWATHLVHIQTCRLIEVCFVNSRPACSP
jgi:hypothetical protein